MEENSEKHRSKRNGRGQYPCHLSRRVQHVFDKDPVAGIRIVDKDMGDGADELAILDDRRAGHADVK